jgi:signal transduction histidine kinase
MFRASIEELVGRLVVETMHPKAERARGRAVFQELSEQGEATVEIQCLRRDGTTFDSEVSARIIDKDKGTIQGIVRDITERKQAERELQKAHLELVNAREQERRRLASELHDSISQDLVAVQLAIREAASVEGSKLSAEQNRLLISATKQCTGVVREVRDICHALYPSTLHTLGLVAALRQLGHYCGKKVEFDLVCADDIDVPRFDDGREIALYRIAQEAVNNALRHAEARSIELRLARTDDKLMLEIIDDGCGFDPTRRDGMGLALTTMNDRARAAGGELTIHSEPGRTCVTVSVPMTGQDKEKVEG